MSIRVAVLSAGAWSQHSHLPTLLADPEVEVCAVSSPDVSTRQSLQTRWPQLTVLSDWQEVLAEQSLDAVVVSSPPAAHVAQVVAALHHGAHVLVEKPFATRLADAQVMTKAAQAARGRLMVGYSWSSCPWFVAARSALHHIGRLEHTDVRLAVNTRELLLGSSDGGWGGRVDSHPDTYTNASLSGGGAGAVSMSHLLSMLLWISGEHPQEVVADTFPIGGDIDRHFTSLLRCESGATMSTSTTSTHAGARETEWSFQFFGDRGELFLDTAHRDLRTIGAEPDALWQSLPIDPAPLVDPHLPTKTLIEVARGNEVDLSGLSGDLGARVVAIAEASYLSVRQRRACPIEPVMSEPPR